MKRLLVTVTIALACALLSLAQLPASANPAGTSDLSREQLRENARAWHFAFSPRLERAYVQRLAVNLAKRDGRPVASWIRQLDDDILSYRARHGGGPFAVTGGASSLPNATAYLLEEAAVADGQAPLPDDVDRMNFALRLFLTRTPAAYATASDAVKQGYYEYAVIFGTTIAHKHQAPSNDRGNLLSQSKNILNAFHLNRPLLPFIYACDTAAGCRSSRDQARAVYFRHAH